MKFTTPARRVLAAGAVSALAAGALVTTTATSASATAVTDQEYTCQGSSQFAVFVDASSATLDVLPGAPAGWDVVAGALSDIEMTFTVPDSILPTLGQLEVDHVEVPNYAVNLGPSAVLVTGLEADTADLEDNGDGTHSFSVTAMNAAFEVPEAGIYDIDNAGGFAIDLYSNGTKLEGFSPICVLAEGTTAQSFRTDFPVAKNDSTSNAKPTKRQFQKGKAASVRVKVSAENEVPTGKVLLKKKSKTLAKGTLNDNGVVVLKTKALPVGKTKLKTVYKGDAYTNKSTDTVTVKVVR